jgi:Gpi18-like mannosyltransferase
MIRSDSGIEAARIPRMNPAHDLRRVVIVVLALIALALKLAIAYNTIGTNDAVFFYGFAKVLSQHSLQWTYEHSRYFNHPPLTAYYLRGIFALTEQHWCQDLGIHFPFLLRLPGIVADFAVVLVVIHMAKRHFAIPNWALGLFALSPVSLMVSGFHGNTDSVMVLLLVCTVWMCLEQQPALAGLFFTLGCQIKIVPLLLLPAFCFYWASRKKGWRFLLPMAVTMFLLWLEPLLNFPVQFAKNVLAYGSYWGIWGVTYFIRLSGQPEFSRLSFFDLTPAQNLIVSILKVIIVGAALWLAWRHRHTRGRAFVESLAHLWLLFFIFAPGVCPQYLIWLAPFVIVLSPCLYTAILVASSIFLFAFYDITSGGLPWSVALAMDESKQHWTVWALLPWVAITAGSAIRWRNITGGNVHLGQLRLGKITLKNA